jgi:hypothetical protein
MNLKRPIDYLEFYKTYIPPPPISSLQEPYEKHHRKYGERWKAAYAQVPLWMKEMSWLSFWRENMEDEKRARFVARINALPEKDQAAFWRGVMAVVDAGCKTGTAPEDMAKYWGAFFNTLKENT